MKTNYKIYLVSIFFLIFVCVACSKDNEREIKCNDVVVTDSGISSPQWLVEKSDSIRMKHTFRPWIYSGMYNNQEYILIYDGLNSAVTHTFYNCSGYMVDLVSELYWDLLNLYAERKFTLLWPKS